MNHLRSPNCGGAEAEVHLVASEANNFFGVIGP